MTIKFPIVGHVDHGKSTLCGHLLYLTGAVSEHDMKNISSKAEADKMLSYKWARVLDIYEEEQRKGKTNEYTEIGFAFKDNKYALIDTPGHKIFIRSMISGISHTRLDLGCLCISAAPKEFDSGFERGQTKEDILLVRAVGITNLIVVINKMDLIGFNEETFSGYVKILDKYLKQLNFASVTYVPVSGYQGIGLVNTENMPDWYKGKCLLDVVVDVANKDKSKDVVNGVDATSYNTKEIIVSFNVLAMNDNVITVGYSGICHSARGEHVYKINKILSVNGKQVSFAKTKDKMEAIVGFENVVTLSKQDKLIFRDKENTIGFGKVLRVKPHNA